MIPDAHTCDGEDTKPPLRISNVPPKMRSFAIVFDDPDSFAGTWIH